MASPPFVVFGPPGRRITNLSASPNGRSLACKHVPQNYSTADYHCLFFRQAGATYVEIGALPFQSSMSGFAPLDDGGCLILETEAHAVDLVRYEPLAGRVAEVARWNVAGTLSLNDACLRLLPSGQEALVLVTDQDDKQVDWGGGPPPDYIQTWLLIDVASGETREETRSVNLGEPELSLDTFRGSRGVSVLVALGAPPWLGTRPARGREALQKIILPLAWKGEELAIRAGRSRLLTSRARHGAGRRDRGRLRGGHRAGGCAVVRTGMKITPSLLDGRDERRGRDQRRPPPVPGGRRNAFFRPGSAGALCRSSNLALVAKPGGWGRDAPGRWHDRTGCTPVGASQRSDIDTEPAVRERVDQAGIRGPSRCARLFRAQDEPASTSER